MLLSWFFVLFWLQGASFFTPPIWFAALRVLCMKQRAMPSLVTGSSSVLDAQYERNYWPFSFHIAWATMTGGCGVQASSDPSSVVLWMEGGSSSRNDTCEGSRCVEKLCRNHMVSGRKHFHTSSLKQKTSFMGPCILEMEKISGLI